MVFRLNKSHLCSVVRKNIKQFEIRIIIKWDMHILVSFGVFVHIDSFSSGSQDFWIYLKNRWTKMRPFFLRRWPWTMDMAKRMQLAWNISISPPSTEAVGRDNKRQTRKRRQKKKTFLHLQIPRASYPLHWALTQMHGQF